MECSDGHTFINPFPLLFLFIKDQQLHLGAVCTVEQPVEGEIGLYEDSTRKEREQVTVREVEREADREASGAVKSNS